MTLFLKRIALFVIGAELLTAVVFQWVETAINMLLVPYTGLVFFLGTSVLVCMLAWLVVYEKIIWQRRSAVFVGSVVALVLVTLIPVFFSGLFAAQLFGLLFEVNVASAMYVLFVHMTVVYLLFQQRDHYGQLLVHALGVSGVVYTGILYFAGPDTAVFVPALWLLNVAYAYHCAGQLEELILPTIVLPVFVTTALLIIVTPAPVILHCFSIVLIGATLVRRQHLVEAFYTLVIALVLSFSLVLTFSQSIESAQEPAPNLMSVPTVIWDMIVTQTDDVAWAVGLGPGGATYYWQQTKDAAGFAFDENSPQGLYVGSFAATHMVASGFIGLLVWGGVLCIGLQYCAQHLFSRRLVSTQDMAALVYVVTAGVVVFFLTPSYLAVLIAVLLLALNLEVSHTQTQQRVRFKSFFYLLFLIVFIIQLALLKHVISIGTAYDKYAKALSDVGNDSLHLTRTSLERSVETREHPTTLRMYSQVVQVLLRQELAQNTIDGRAIESEVTRLIVAADAAVAKAPLDYRNWMVLGNGYMLLSQLNVGDAAQKAGEAFAQAAVLHPHNHEVTYMQAQLAIIAKDYTSARNYIGVLRSHDPNDQRYSDMLEYVEAVQTESQIDGTASE